MSKQLTTGQIFAREMRATFAIGTRTRRFMKKKIGGHDMHATVMQAIADANNWPGYYAEERQAIFRTAFMAFASYQKHIAGYRADCMVIAHINALSPWQFCSLIGEMVDAGISNVGEGELFFKRMRDELFAQAA